MTKQQILVLLRRALGALSKAWPLATGKPLVLLDHGLQDVSRALDELSSSPQTILKSEERTVTLMQAALRVEVSPARVRRAADRGYIRFVRTAGGHRRVVLQDAINHFLGWEDNDD